MAKAKMKMPEEFLLKLSKLGKKTDEIIPEILYAGAEVTEKEIKTSLEAVIGKNTKYESRSTGEMIKSLGTTKALQDREGNYNVKIGFAENRSDGAVNALIANTIEYGKSGQSPKPFLKPAKRKSKKKCIETMTKKFDEEVSKL